jgi:hypothetical protein
MIKKLVIRSHKRPKRIFEMPATSPITAAGSRDEKRPAPIPKSVKLALVLMVRGLPDNPDAPPLDFISAAKLAGVAPDRMRRWLDRAEVLRFLRAERKAWRAALCAANESVLAAIRDRGENAMARVQAIKTLELLDEESTERSRGAITTPGLVIVVEAPKVPALPGDVPRQMLLDVTPAPLPPRVEEFTPPSDPIVDIADTDIEPIAEPRYVSKSEELERLQDSLLSRGRLAPASMQGAPKQPYDPGYEPPRRRGWRRRRVTE